MFDTRQTKAEIIAAATVQNERLVSAYLEINRLRAGIQAFLDGDYEPRIKKIEKCKHDRYGYQGCEACIEEHFQRVLSGEGQL